MLNFSTNIEELYNELLDEVKLFATHVSVEDKIYHHIEYCETEVVNTTSINDSVFVQKITQFDSPLCDTNKFIKRQIKHKLYLALKNYYKKQLPWGSLTGVRPTKLAYEHYKWCNNIDETIAYLQTEFDVSNDRAEIIKKILNVQAPHISNFDSSMVDLYIHIPFCESRCNYCSFPSMIVDRRSPLLDKYMSFLMREIEQTLRFIEEQDKRVSSVYIGGGTPSILSHTAIAELLSRISHLNVEKTFEAGRPDCITADKLNVLHLGGVSRICLNPQTLNNDVLKNIHRNHTAEDFFHIWSMLHKYDFIINADLIAGLDGDNLQSFSASLDKMIQLAPDNITVHTLSRKRASDNAYRVLECANVERMLEYAMSMLSGSGYNPYYIYKQKYMLGNFENTGYSKLGKECVNNISVMEEILPVYACGAGAISKNISSDGHIDRYQNAKDIKLYTEEFDIRLAKKLISLSK